MSNPQSAVFVSQAVREHQVGHFAEAEALYLKALEFNAIDADALALLGTLHLQQGREDIGLSFAVKGLICEPDQATSYNNLGLVLKALSHPGGAIRCYIQATVINPDFGDAHNNMGVIYRSEGALPKAIECYRNALDADPTLGEAYNNLANALQDLGEIEEAVDQYLLASQHMPNSDTVHHNVGLLLDRQGRKQEALSHFHQALAINPDRDDTKHLVAALSGKTTEAAPPAYVKDLFDSYAHRFEAHLVGELQYSTPKEILEVLGVGGAADRQFRLVLDLGCGTGLAGEKVRGQADWLEGVDLSAKMLQQAENKGAYNRLHEADIVDFLQECEWQPDLMLAADVLVYLGRLEPLFSVVGHRLAPGGLFAFSVEAAPPAETWTLRASGRYAHSQKYIRELVEANGMRLVAQRNCMLRMDRGKPIEGFVLLAAKPTLDGSPL